MAADGRKQNHVAAEKKRREAIRQGFDKLTSVLPGLDSRNARSEAVVIQKCVEYLELLEAEQAQLRALAEENNDAPSTPNAENQWDNIGQAASEQF